MDDNQNPYHAPQAEVRRAERVAQLVTASRGQRFIHYLIDTLACYAIMFAAMLVYVGIGGEAVVTAMQEPNPLCNVLISVTMILVYYVPMEGMFGVTLGKLVTGTRVVDEQGRPPSWGQVFGRTFARLIPFEAFSLLFSRDDRVSGWHDRLPKTLVVRSR